MVAVTVPTSENARVRWKLAVIAIIKDEEKYIEEWVVHHQSIGVQHFFIFDHGSTDRTRAILERYNNRGLVTVIDWPRIYGQLDAYEYGVRLASGMADWAAIIDMDEFICPREGVDVNEYLRDVDADQVLVRWKWFGHSGHREAPTGLVTENYWKTRTGLSDTIKSIFRPATVLQAGVHVQRTRDRRTVDALGAPASEAWQLDRPARAEAPEPLQVNHYYCRSYEEYLHKMNRGDANVNKVQIARPFEYFDFPDEDRQLQGRARDLKKRIATFNALPADPAISGSLGYGVSPATTTSFYTVFRDRMVDAITSDPDPAATAVFRKSSSGLHLEIQVRGDTPDETIVRGLHDRIADFFNAVQAQSGGTINTVPADEPKLRHRLPRELSRSVLPGHLVIATVLRTTGFTSLRFRVDGKRSGDGVIDRTLTKIRDPGLWIVVQLATKQPLVPARLRIGWSEASATPEILDATAWFVR